MAVIHSYNGRVPPSFAQHLLTWYAAHHRILPWRGLNDPYAIWISEIMLQQTQVETVKPYFARWLKRFPTVQALAQAPLQDVLTLWEGLGYYSRARNLHRAAHKVVREFNGQLPNSVEQLLTLPGIGRYTAGAIASIAFGVDAAVLDGNVKRVLARAFNYSGEVKSPAGEKELWALAESLLPHGQAGDYNQALMDLGATLCTPRNPTCLLCPVNSHCEALKLGVVAERPVVRARAAVPHHSLAVAVIRKQGRVLVVQRAADELLGGLWMFPTVRVEKKETPVTSLRRHLRAQFNLAVQIQTGTQTISHAYTHFKITATVYNCQWKSGQPKLNKRVKWATLSSLTSYPMGKVDRRIAQSLWP